MGTEDYVPARGILDDIGMFDADFFGIPPAKPSAWTRSTASFSKPARHALEDAGYVSHDYPGEIGLFAGCSLNTYLLANLAHDRAFVDELTGNYQVGEFAAALGNDKDFLTTRAAYKLQPARTRRQRAIRMRDLARRRLPGRAVAAPLLLRHGPRRRRFRHLPAAPRPRLPGRRHRLKRRPLPPLRREATGTVFGHGVGVVLLKRLDEALRDGDHIDAVIRGFAVNNDGSAKAGYMAPGVEGQARVIAAAQAMAGVSPAEISYIEAHGTGTPLGDPIEVAALTRVFAAAPDAACVIGTAKGNVGHLDAAAGITGLIKTTLSLQHQTLAGLAHFQSANSNLDFAHSPFRFEAQTKPWLGQTPSQSRRQRFWCRRRQRSCSA